MWGPDLTLGNDKLELNLQYVWRKDTKAFHGVMNDDIETKGAIAELIYTSKVTRASGIWLVYLIG